MKLILMLAIAGTLMAGCQTTNYSPMERHLNRYAGAEVAASRCPAYGGYGSVAAMRADAEKNLAQARNLGATDADIQKARERLNGNMAGATILVGDVQACNSLINNLAWAGSAPATTTPGHPVKPTKK